MNRTIKFRVWNKRTNNWVDGCGPNKRLDLDGVNLFGETILFGAFMNNVGIEELNDCVALQYTGLNDKNGKGIFEGDIISFGSEEKEDLFQVIWDDTEARFILDSEGGLGDWLCDEKDRKIIGNIFENPDLIK